jgi:Protein of unknown function (DUF3040)
MLSDAEQRRLTGIEDGLRSADPQFVENFGHESQSGPTMWRGITPRAWLVAAAWAMGLAVLMAGVGMNAIGLCVAGVGAGLWLTGCSRPKDGRRQT